MADMAALPEQFQLISETIGRRWGTSPNPVLISKVWKKAEEKGLDPATIVALVSLETKGTWNPEIVADDKHGYGLFQIDDRWHKDQGRDNVDKHIDLGLQIFSDFRKRSKSDEEAISRYNTGDPKSGFTNGYVQEVSNWKALIKQAQDMLKRDFFMKNMKGTSG